MGFGCILEKFSSYLIAVRVVYFLLLILFVGCAPLKRSQVILVGNYFNTIAEYPYYIKELMLYQADLTLQADNISNALLASDSLRIVELIESVERYEAALVMPDSVGKELVNLEGYIRGYYLLAPNGFDIYKTLKNTTESIVGMFGLKGVASAVLPDVESNVSAFKKRKIYAHYTNESQNLLKSVTILKAYIDGQIIPEIDEAQSRINSNVRFLFAQEGEAITPLEYYFDYNQYFTAYFQRINRIRKLAMKISESLEHIAKTDKEIQKMTKQRQKILRDSRKLHQLLDDVSQIKRLKDELLANRLSRSWKAY